MFAHKCYLRLGEATGLDFRSLAKEGYELSNFSYSFQQGIDHKGKASTEVVGGSMSMTLSMLPPQDLIEWGVAPHQFKKGVVVILDDHNIPQEKIFFENAACVFLGIDYFFKGNMYATTNLTLRAERLIMGSGLDFDNFWTK